MNILGLVFSLILILSYGFSVCWEKQFHAHRLRSTYLANQNVSRKILNSYESELYKNLRAVKNPTPTPARDSKPTPQPNPVEKKILNSDCARLNLWPLVLDGREEQPILYELAARLLRIFYSQHLFENKARFEYVFLDQFLLAAKKASQKPEASTSFLMEKLTFKESRFQTLYYKMLKGTKEWDLPHKFGYPTLLDYVKLEPEEEKICLLHAHTDLLTVFFGPKAAAALFTELHKKKPTPLTPELIEQVCSLAQIGLLDPDLLELIRFDRKKHTPGPKKTMIEEDEKTHLSLRKNLYIGNG